MLESHDTLGHASPFESQFTVSKGEGSTINQVRVIFRTMTRIYWLVHNNVGIAGTPTLMRLGLK